MTTTTRTEQKVGATCGNTGSETVGSQGLNSAPSRTEFEAAAYRRIRNPPDDDRHGDLYVMCFHGADNTVLKSVALDVHIAAAMGVSVPCIGNDKLCPCQDGDACHYKDAGKTKGWPTVPEQQVLAEFVRVFPRSLTKEEVGELDDAVMRRLRTKTPESLGVVEAIAERFGPSPTPKEPT